YSDLFRVTPTFKVYISTNHKPVIRGTDHGIWRRIRLVPFDVVIPGAEQDKTLRDKLRAELPGILRWAVEGCLAWQRDGLGIPDEVRAATADYRAEMDRLAGYLRERCVVENGASVASGDLYRAYQDWAKDNGETILSARSFASALVE